MAANLLGLGITGTTLTTLERKILRDAEPYAIILFSRNVEGATQLRELTAEIKSTSSTPPLIMIDQEGGRVDRLRQILPGFPSAESFLEGERSEELAHWFGRVTGMALRHFDIDVNLGPVVDVRRKMPTRGLERRCFGSDPETVIRLAGAFMRGQHEEGTASCLKHYPGLGGGSGDPHYGASIVDVDPETFFEVDLAPYAALADEAGSIMVGHAVYPQIEGGDEPATLSYAMTTGILRKRLGFRGLAISDDMEMHAVSDLAAYEIITERALLAGNDVILFCAHIEQMPALIRDINHRAGQNDQVAHRVREATERAEKYRAHCEALRQQYAARPKSFEEVEAELDRFCEQFEATRFDGTTRPPSERRQSPRSPGTGKTGREEWT
jgi:beta-N-acetylhexosaminidase